MGRVSEKSRKRTRRKMHIRKQLAGTAARPRVSVFRSNRHMYVQAIDDATGRTLVSASSLEKDLSSLKNTVEAASKLGDAFGKRLIEKDLKTVVFDRNGYKYHGIVKAIAEGTRKAGIDF